MRSDDGARQPEFVPRFVISVVATMTGLHPQTLRQYDQLDIVRPQRTAGRARRYSHQDVQQLRQVQELTGQGVNLEGVRRILALEQQVEHLLAQLEQAGQSPSPTPRSRRGETQHTSPSWVDQDLPYLPVPYTVPATSLVIWRRTSP